MFKTLIFLFILPIFLLPSSCTNLSQADDHQEFIFRGFKDHAESKPITLNGAAKISQNGLLKLTNDTPKLVGHAFYQTPINFKRNNQLSSFSTAFAFSIVPEYKKLGGHGFAFTISKSKGLNGSLPSQYLGLMSSNNVGNFTNHVFAVEFDTVQDYEFGDINGNHVGIDINSLVSNVSVNATCFVEGNSRKEDINLKSGKRIQAWIDYESDKKVLNVTLSLSSSKPNSSIISLEHVDLSSIFMDYMYVGFSASTGLLASSHYIYGWSFTTNGQAQSLDLSSLPEIPSPRKSYLVFILSATFLCSILLVLALVILFYIVKKIRNRDVIELWELDIGPHRFSYKELKKATRGFRDDELLGFGGFGRVYKGILPDSNAQVAVKRISHESKQGLREFVSEIASIGRLRHRNLVPLQGWCRKRGDLLLVYDFMPNGSLDKYIFGEPKIILTWEQRFKIIKGVASGLLYLHEEWEQTVIHRDIKAGNVLLDCEMNGRLGDFGLAKLYEHGSNPSTTKVVGTLGYLAPELTKTGKPTTSSDVYVFGALLLEVVCGRRPIEAKAMPEELILVDWAWDKWREGCILELVDPRMKGEYDEVEVVVVIKLGLMCSNNAPNTRPGMRQVMRYLEGEVQMPEVLEAPNEYEYGKKVGNGGGIGSEVEDLVHSYPSSSYYEKVSTWSLGYEDLEAGSISPSSTRRDVDIEAGSILT